MALSLGTLQVDIGADTTGLQAANSEVQSVGQRMTRTFGRVGAAIAAAVSVEAARRIILIADNMSVLERRLVRFTGSAEKAEKTMTALVKTSSDAGVQISSTLAIFQRFSLVRDDIGATNEEIIKFTDTLSKLGAIGGSSQQEVSNALVQLSQGLAGGVLRAEEFNSIIENTPEIAKAMAREMGLSMGKLRAEMLKGELTSERVFKAMQDAAEETDRQFAEMPKSILMVTQSLKNNLAVAIKNIDQSLDFSASISKTIEKMSIFVETANRGVTRTRQLKKQGEDYANALANASLKEQINAKKINKLLEERSEIFARLREREAGSDAANRLSDKKLALSKEIKELTGESEILKGIQATRAGIIRPLAANDAGDGGDTGAAKVDIEPEISKSDQKRLDKLKLLGETEREEIARIALERKEFVLSQTQLEGDERQELLDKINDARLSALDEQHSKELSMQEAAAAQQKAAREQQFADSIEGLTTMQTAMGELNQTALGDNKKFAALQAGISLAINVAKASEAGFPANIPLIAGAVAQGAMIKSLLTGGGRQMGGQTSHQLATPINEAGTPEILTEGGRQYLLPTGNSGNVTPLKNSSSTGAAQNITIISNGTPQTITGSSVTKGEVQIMIDDSGRRLEGKINSSLRSGRGESAAAIKSGFKVERKLNA